MLIAALILAQAATATTSERADARCVAAFGLAAERGRGGREGGGREGGARAAQLGALYFYGKLVGRRPGVDLHAALLDAAAAIGPDPKTELKRCGAELGKAGAALSAAGEEETSDKPGARKARRPAGRLRR